MNFKKWMIACMAVLVAGTLFFVADTGHAEAEHDHADEVGLGHDEHGHAHVDGEAEPAVAAEQAHADEADDVHDDDALRLTLEQRVRFGIVVTNAIVLLDLVERLRAQGLSTHEALIEGGRTRVRPIPASTGRSISA